MRFNAPKKQQDLGAFAFYQGAHDIPLEQTVREIIAAHDMERAKLEEESIHRYKPLEATVERFERERGDADATWKEVTRRLGFHEPPVVAARIVGALGFASLAVDAILLGPGLDAVGISAPAIQFVAALGLAALSATLFHLVYETFGQHQHTSEIVTVRRGLAGFAIFALLTWGVLRGYQVKFAADIAQNPLGGFLGKHSLLAAVFFCFVTLSAPLVGAAAYHDAAPRLRDCVTWKRAKRRYEEVHSKLVSTQKSLEEECLVYEKEVRRLDAQQRNWAAAAQHHERGRINGARQDPNWVVVTKATGWSMLGFALGCVGGTYFAPLYFLMPIGAGMAGFLYHRRARVYPNYDQFKRLENTRFAITEDRTQIIAASHKLPPSAEDER